jgi:uncharacterized Fe-S cluster protein YjdI/CDGSH-type Zn-finger protein
VAVRKVYRGSDIEVSFDLDLCVHIGECLRGHHGVFRLERRPWLLPDQAEPDEVAEIVERCPSGALQYRRLDGGRSEAHQGTTVTAIRNGPLLVTGDIEVRREDGTVEALPRATLCRCGFSKHKPFCDNEHIAMNFQAPGVPYKIHISPVRPRLEEPISKTDDPRRLS